MRRMEVPMSGLDARPSGLSRRWRLLLLGVAALLALLLVGWQLAARQLQQQIVVALGPRASVDAAALGWGGVEITGLRIAAAPKSGWPAADELRAARVRVVPDLWAALRGTVSVRSIAVEDGYIALLRTRDGRLRVLPALLESHGPKQPREGERSSSMPSVRIGTVTLERTEVAFYDASVRHPPHLLRLADIAARIGPLQLPALDTPTDIALTALLQGAQSHAKGGRLTLDGEVTGATRDADLALRLRGVDVVALQPYLGRDANIRRGGLDLDLTATVQRQRLHAPGHLVLTQLEFGGGGGLGGLPRQALVAFASKNERIELDFTLEGRLDDPKFSLNENLATRIASAMADKLGLSVGGMVEGVGSVVKGLFGQ